MSRRPLFVSLAVALVVASPAAAVDPALLAGIEARAVGPAGMSGRIGDIAAAASDPDTIYVGAATGGLWKSVDGGLVWKPIFDDQPVAAIGAVAIDPNNPDIVWVGTGEGNTRNSVSVGNGVYKSLDGGDTWTHLGLDETERIHRILLHPREPGVAWVAALGPLWGESAQRGVFKTSDGGESWQKVLHVDEKTGAADLALDPINPDKLFAAMWEHRRWPWFFRSGGPGSGLYRSFDGGETWTRLTPEDGMPEGELGRIGIAVCRGYPEVVYALVEAEESALLRSRDGGRSFTTVNSEYDIAQRPFYYADIRCDPEWPQRVYDLASRVRVSDDGGKSFSILPGSRRLHGDYQALWINPEDPTHLIIGNDGGVGISYDRGATWRYVANLPVAQYYHIAVDDETPYNIYGGMQDNGSWRGPSSVRSPGGILNHHWVRLGGGDGFDTLPDPEDATQGYSMWQGGNLQRWDLVTRTIKPIKPPQPGDDELRFNWSAGLAIDPFEPATIYYGSQHVHKSTDRGASWTVISPDLTSDNPEWQKQRDSGGLTPDVTGAENFTTIIAIAPSAVERGVIWVGTDDGRLHLTRDGGDSWQSVEDNVPGVPDHTWIPHIEPSHFDGGEAFVVFDDHRRSNWTPYVYRTRDYGASWSKLVDDDLWGYALAIAQDPVDRDLLFLGTEFGLYVSPDGGDEWFKWTHGVPTVSVADLVVHPRAGDLVLGTHGRSAFVLDDISPLRELDDEIAGKPLHLFPVADAQQFYYGGATAGANMGAESFRGENRPYGALVTFWLGDDDLPHPDEEVERRRQEEKRRSERARRAEAGEQPEAGQERAERPRRRRTGAGPGGGAGGGMRPGAGGPGSGKGPKVEIEITGADGEVVRTFDADAHQGLNRVAWDLGRDPGKSLPRRRGGFFGRGQRSGPELPPGTYTVTVRHGEHEDSQPVEILADPTSTNTEADWQAREAALERAGALSDALADAVERTRDTATAMDRVVAAARDSQDEDDSDADDEGEDQAEEAEEAQESGAEAGSERDDSEDDEAEDSPHRQLIEQAREIKEKLQEVEKKLWTPPGTRGIVRRGELSWDVFMTRGAITSTWAPPSPTDLAHLERAETKLGEVIAELNGILDEDVEELRRKVSEAGLELLPEPEPVVLGGGDG